MASSFNRGSLSLGVKLLGVSVVCLSMASCATTQSQPQTAPAKKTRSKEYFSEKEYGVKASPRVVSEGQPVPKGGGRFMVGDPYQVKGKTYVPKEDPNYNKSGLASWYGSAFHGRYTANGEVYDSSALTAAHPTFPLPSYARVTNLENGSSVVVRVNDRGPYHEGRILDVSGKTAELLDIKRTGTAKVNVQYVGRARMDGEDMPFLMASYVRKGDRLPSFNPGGQIASGVMVASNQSFGDQLQSYGSALPQPVASANRTPSKPKPATAAAQPTRTIDRASVATARAPQLAERPAIDRSASPVRVAMASPTAVLPVQTRPAPVQTKPVAGKPAPQTAQPRMVQPAVRAPVETAATAYVSAPKSKGPQVMFGGVLLQD
ncbi:septal ring lytic transglycosylase RlpA family protein [Neorhizobium lilium]|uniref:Endolytic peptidoglycan transglycosylase RlpA n=1 Tax=Neorhizobium lilium TaxID=2503024 RepID=A0A444L9S2_9HYPH|nr:septal ring lytic transglycosylase RlpA family protein [Neorhizobium lilium]RWX74346.1 septal ring lytic transglycosylase RlpA family protein [Neorhizobium lilium]